MRHYPLWALFLIFASLHSCRKPSYDHERQSLNQSDYLTTVMASLQSNMNPADFKELDFNNALLSKKKDSGLYYLRIPLQTGEFVIVKTTVQGMVESGKIVYMKGAIKDGQWNGSIKISSLDRKTSLQSPVVNGFIEAFHKKNSKASPPLMSYPWVTLPEVIVVGTYSAGGGISWSSWLLLTSLLNPNGTYYFGYYGSYDPNGSTGGGGGTGTGGSTDGTINEEELITIDFEPQYNDQAIDLSRYLSCFETIPDDGATCTISILTDLPVDGDPDKLFNWEAGSPGHTFIQLTKENGSDYIFQNIGFYPKSGWKTSISPVPIDGKFVDNHHHEYNAAYKVTVRPDQLRTAITRMLYLQRFVKYDIDDYNCTDWSLSVFNEAIDVRQRLEIPKIHIPGGENPNGSNTPQGLYKKLKEMKEAGGATADHISIPTVGWVGGSTGVCK